VLSQNASVQGGEENTRQDLRGLQNGALSTTLNGRRPTFQAKLRPKPRRSERLRQNKLELASIGWGSRSLPEQENLASLAAPVSGASPRGRGLERLLGPRSQPPSRGRRPEVTRINDIR